MADVESDVLVLTAGPGRLNAEAVGLAAAALGDGMLGLARWLGPGEAWEVNIAPGFEAQTDTSRRIRHALAGRSVDANVAAGEPAGRRKQLLMADMDSTIIGQECIDELADFAGLKAHVAAITERAMRGEIAFEPALRERVALLKGLPVAVIEDVITERVRLNPGARTLIATMRAHGAYTCLVSGGFTAFTERVAAMAGFDESRGNILEVEADRLAGTVRDPILGREAKRTALIALRSAKGLGAAQTIAVGDGANDLAMLSEAGLGVAYRAKPAVAAAAHARLDHSDLTALLYLQGYRREEFAPAG
jgi:phosphoserine phosphatase